MKRRILVVEDDSDLRHLYSSWLSLAGFAVDTAGDGIVALERVEQEPPDLLLLDLGLPLLRGEHVVNELAARAHTREISIVIVTGEPVSLAPVAASCVLHKPVDLERLVDTVRRCLATTISPIVETKPKKRLHRGGRGRRGSGR